jgi:HEAT repeat protein
MRTSIALALLLPVVALADDPPDLFSEDFARYARLVESPVLELRLEGVQGFGWLKHYSAELYLLGLAKDDSPEVRREVAFALQRVGRRDSVPVLFEMLKDPDVGVRQHAALSLQSLTQAEEPTPAWWQATSAQAYEHKLLADLKTADGATRVRALKALRCFAGPEAEAPLLEFVTSAQPPADGTQQALAIAVLERIGTPASLPWLASVAEQQPTATWALGQIGGPEAEEALIRGLRRFGVWDPQHLINLDRLHSTRCGEFVPMLVGAYGCVTYRGQPENLTYDPTPLQRACTNLILRSGRGPEVVECVLREMECSVVDEQIPGDLRPAMVALREELRPGFVRNDGLTTSQPMCAMSHLIRDRRLAPRLIPLLQHPAFVARVYAAMALGRLHAVEALPAIVDAIDEGYPFADPMALASGKHFGESQTVRWRSFLCMALGRMGGDEARHELERLACDPDEYRDIRYGAVVGLGFIGAPESLPVLQQVAHDDIIWRIRVEAQDVAHRIELAQEDARLRTR